MKTLKDNDLGKKYLVEDCYKINVNSVIREERKNLIPNLMNKMVEIGGFSVSLRGKFLYHGGQRLWFICPLCQKSVGIIFKHPNQRLLGCRSCLELDYKSRRYKGMVENS